MPIVYRDEDADLAQLQGRPVGVIGYGHLGRPFALNLRDSGVEVIVSERDPARLEQAQAEGFAAAPADELARRCRVLLLLVSDEAMPRVYLEQVSPNLQRGDMLVFSSAYNVAFGYIEAPPFVDVGLIAPRTLGAAVRERYESGEGFFSFIAVGQDATGRAWPTLLALAGAVGTLRAGAVEIAFEREAELDLFVQQAVLPALHHVLASAARLLIDAGHPPEVVFTELYLSGELRDYLDRAGRSGLIAALRQTSLTGQYGAFTRFDRFNDLKLQRLMEITLEEIRAGDFAREWAKECGDNYRRLRRALKSQEAVDLWELEQQAIDLLYPLRDAEDNIFKL